ncbi:MAG: hypothetical protein E7290_11865 [Lachnospiraceae bacterium]|nr:hypothetical protein [Lachnospiraceae bacterium]
MKSKGHIYMANLILEELKTKDNLFIDYNGVLEEYEVPDMIKKALLAYPACFRAGAIGPDFFPDMLIGQMTIHPENSGKWLHMMYEELCAMPPQDEETKQALAFYMGYMLHYAGDMFTHHYVNSYARGWFPDFMGIWDGFNAGDYEGATEKILIILRHLAVEAYLDDYIVDGLKATGHEGWITQEQTISIPIEYLRSCFGTKTAIMRAAEITGEEPFSTNPKEMNFLKVYVSYLEKYREKSLYNSDMANGGDDAEEDYCSRTQFVADEIEKMEGLIVRWLQFWETFAQKSLLHGTKTALDESDKELMVLIPEYLTQNETYLDIYNAIKWVIDLLDTINIHIPIISELIDYIKEKIKDMLKEAAFPYIYRVANIIVGEEKSKEIDDFDEAIEVIKDAFMNPVHLINNPLIFGDTMLADKLRTEWDNLGRIVDGNGITFLPFYRGLTMGKLCIAGVDELNGIMKKYGQPECFKKGRISAAIQNLRVIVHTSNKNYADTNKDVFFRIIRKDAEPVIMALAGNYFSNFKKNKRDVFELNLPCTVAIEDIERFELQLVGENLWIYKYVIVEDARTGIVLATGGEKKLYHKEISEIPLFDNLEEAYKNCTLVNSVFKLGITIKTATARWSGTDNDVKFSIHMKDHTSKEITLDKSWYNDFENGDLDTYYMTLDQPVRVEDIESFGIRKSGSDDWKVALLIVFDADTSNCLCRANVDDWVGSKGFKFPVFDIEQIKEIDEIKEEEIIQRTLVIIKTKKTSWGGTNDDIYLCVNIKDDNGNVMSEKHELNTSWHDDFEQGDTDTFIVRLDNAVKRKNVVSFELCKKGSDDWCIEYYSVYDLDSLYHFGTADGKWFRTENDVIAITAKV